ncbi:MFS family permease [Trueperella bonasi]|uniref:MFS family permease n=1 Tax=Trueperella bonasi TaxID=312286 RepID=A0ABT9NF20_9ACTO|nr:hypothetical protein [Trueperella bonasi]MDP9805960.1 MFS family permease [Trueperella bonasi]
MTAWNSDPYGKPSESVANYQSLTGLGGVSRSVIPLRPLSVGETLDSAVRLIRFNPVAFIVFPLIVNLVAGAFNVLITLLFGETTIRNTSISAEIPVIFSILTTIVALIAGLIVLVAGTRVTLASIRGKKLTLNETFTEVKAQFGRLSVRMLGLLLITIAATVLFTFTAIFLVVSLVRAFEPGVSGVLFTLLMIPMIIGVLGFLLFYRFSVTAPAMVAEDIGPLSGLSRSWSLTKGSLGYFIGLLLTLIVIGIALNIVAAIFIALFGGIGFAGNSESGMFLAGSALGTVLVGLVVSIFIAPFTSAITNLVYVNMRMRRENFHQDVLYSAGPDQSAGGYIRQEGPYGQPPQSGYGQWSSPQPPTNPGFNQFNHGTDPQRPTWYEGNWPNSADQS